MEVAPSTAFSVEVLGRGEPDAVALVTAGESLTYAGLRTRIAARAGDLDLGARSVVAVSGTASLELVVTYLAVLDAGHVPLLVGAHLDRLVDAWDPAAVVDVRGGDVRVERRRAQPVDLHPDLALLLSTSGTTGSPKLVRLSHANLMSNADAIAEFLRLTADDRAVTTLPLHYCYGLSVLHSHLAAGASLVVTEASVVDPCFAAAMRDHGVTNVAGVPHTYDLLERAGVERLHVPTLRLMTQAGGRMPPATVARWIRRADGWGAEFVVMYGQTEATARMAYLPPVIARRRPGAIGLPIPGGELSLRPVDGLPGDVGELVYRGPNVMLGYASSPADLAGGATIDELRTGDLGRFHADDGVFEIVGRRSRFVKPFGLRVDLDAVERELATSWPEVGVAGDDEHVVVLTPGADESAVRAAVCDHTTLPATVIVVDVATPVPRTPSGKVDHAAVLQAGAAVGARRSAERATDRGGTVAAVFADVLGRPDVGRASTFVSLGGDSLSYVECSLQLERVLGHVPADWHVRTVASLDALAPTECRRHLPRLDTTVILRAIGICTVVATHMHLRFVPGGAHLMLAVVGYNVSRFLLPIDATAERVRAGLRTAARVAVPAMAWVAVGLALGVAYGTGTLLLVNNYVGPRSHRGDHWHFWFIEVFVHLVLLTTLVMAVPAVRRADRRFPYGVPLAAFLVALALRLDWAQAGDWYNLRYRTHGVAWFFLLGWLAHRSTALWQRVVTTVLCLLTVPGFFELAQRDWFIAVGLVVLVWWRDVPFPRVLRRPVTTIAAASMWIYITHFTVWPPLDDVLRRDVAYVAALLVGVLVWVAYDRAGRAIRQMFVSSVGTSGSAGAPAPSSSGRVAVASSV